MMWSSIEHLKENLNKIALDVHEGSEELGIYGEDDSSLSDRRASHGFAHSKSLLHSPVSNGIDSTQHNPEIERYKQEIKRLQESEAEIKALSVNYAALLKEKEEQLCRLNEENGSLRKNLDGATTVLSASKIGSSKGTGDLSPNRDHKFTTQVRNRAAAYQMHNGALSKQDGHSNGMAHSTQSDELADPLEDKYRSVTVLQATQEAQIKQLKLELDIERDKLAKTRVKLHEENKLKGSLQEELNSLKLQKDKTSMGMSEMRSELNEKISEIRRLQMELQRMEHEKQDDIVNDLRKVIANLEKENTTLKVEKNELESALKIGMNSSTGKIFPDVSEISDEQSSTYNEKEHSSGTFPGREELELSLQKMEKDLKEVCQERDKALQELKRLKQHLLEKELEESEKMDEDSKIIEELREKNEYQRAQILHLEKALKQAVASQEEVKMFNYNELQRSKEMINDLNKKLASCLSTIDAKNIELLNLQTALGQYYAEIEAKEHLEGDLALAREESAKLSVLLKDANQKVEMSNKEKEEINEKLTQAERMLAEGKRTVMKLEEDNAKLRRALEQSMTRLNRMSVDSDYFVDRRIVIKLLVTYFQRNHSKEVLDLMVRMLGFSDEDKQRIGLAQHGAGKGVVRGVLGLPGRLVGGILGGTSADQHSGMASENQSFADLWVDFLLKETEERERREAEEAATTSKDNPHERSPNTTRTTSETASAFPRLNIGPTKNPSPQSSRGNMSQLENSDFEFSTVPLTSPAESNSRISTRLLTKY